MNMPKTHRVRRRPQAGQSGMTLVEILIALSISTVLLTGVIQIFISSKQTYRTLDATSRLQENGRYAIGIINDDLRMSSYTGCYPGTVENHLNSPNDFRWDIANPLEGNEWNGGSWTPALDATISGQVQNDTDVIITRGLTRDDINTVTAPAADQVSVTQAQANGNLNVGDIVIASNCSNSSMFRITELNDNAPNFDIQQNVGAGASGNASTISPDFQQYGPEARIGRLVTNIYYIDTGANGNPTLFRQTLIGNALQTQELADNIENMQILYGVDTNNDGIANQYNSADIVTAAGNMINVTSVRVSLLMRTTDNITSSAQTYTYNGANITASDRRMRRVFTTTVKLRNKGIM